MWNTYLNFFLFTLSFFCENYLSFDGKRKFDDDCLEDTRENYSSSSVLRCVVQLCIIVRIKATQLNSTRRRVELSCVDVAINTSPTQLNSAQRRVELSCVAINGPKVNELFLQTVPWYLVRVFVCFLLASDCQCQCNRLPGKTHLQNESTGPLNSA